MKSAIVLLIYSSFRKDEFAKTTNFRDIFSFVVPKQHSSMANQEQLNRKHRFFFFSSNVAEMNIIPVIPER